MNGFERFSDPKDLAFTVREAGKLIKKAFCRLCNNYAYERINQFSIMMRYWRESFDGAVHHQGYY
jgi:hypothetical protein